MLEAPKSKAVPVLLAEDEPMVRELIAAALLDSGFEVIEARDGAEALALIEHDFPIIEAMVADIRLGSGPDGWAVARRARELNPRLPVVYMSGDSCADWPARGLPNSVMLQKPFEPMRVISAIAPLLGRNERH